MWNLDNGNLSKIKNIYKIKRIGTDVIIESFKVVYINKTYIYYKENGSDRLLDVALVGVLPNLQVLIDRKDHFLSLKNYPRVFFIERPTEAELNSAKEIILEQNRIEIAIKQASEITKYEKEIQILTSKLEKLKKSQ